MEVKMNKTFATQELEVYDPKTHVLVPKPSEVLKRGIFPTTVEVKSDESSVNLLYQIVYPDDLNLKPAPVSLKPRGRPKKLRVPTDISTEKSKIRVVARTRSGRAVKLPKHIENGFKKIEINDDQTTNGNEEIKTCDFAQYTEKSHEDIDKQPIIEHVSLQQNKRKISAQYRCPGCKKAYLGRNKILEHLKKNPSHGPLQKDEEKHFEVWNYLVSLTQKTSSSERGRKFCAEISNVLHNLLLLANALFKKVGNVTSEVSVDKVLGNAIGLVPGNYYFDDSNLYRDVTVLKLISNNDFLSSLKFANDDTFVDRNSETNCKCGKGNNTTEQLNKVVPAVNQDGIKAAKAIQINDNNRMTAEDSHFQNNYYTQDTGQNITEKELGNQSNQSSQCPEIYFDNNHSNYNRFDIDKSFQNGDLYCNNPNSESNNFSPEPFDIGTEFSSINTLSEHSSEKAQSNYPKIKIQSNILN